MAKLRILIADDHAFLRETMAKLIDGEDDMEVVGEASDGKGASAKTATLRPDIVIVDISMPNGGGIEALKTIGKECPGVRSLVLTMHDDQTFLQIALRAGADGYVTKKTVSKELLNAIRTVAGGRQYINVSLTDAAAIADSKSVRFDENAALKDLSNREQDVLLSVARGYTSKEIAAQLGITSASVSSYRLRLCSKLGAKSRADLVDFALEAGLLRARGQEN